MRIWLSSLLDGKQPEAALSSAKSITPPTLVKR
jgi:hypothetical protein